MEWTGAVVKKPFAVGSKSEREAVMLLTESGEYVLRRPGGHPFQDPELDRLVGASIRCKGIVRGYTLIATDLTIVQDSGERQ